MGRLKQLLLIGSVIPPHWVEIDLCVSSRMSGCRSLGSDLVVEFSSLGCSGVGSRRPSFD